MDSIHPNVKKYDALAPVIFEYLLMRSIPLHIIAKGDKKLFSNHTTKAFAIDDSRIRYLSSLMNGYKK